MKIEKLLIVTGVCTILALTSKGQTILGKHPADKVLDRFMSQNTNANSIALGLNRYATVPVTNVLVGSNEIDLATWKFLTNSGGGGGTLPPGVVMNGESGVTLSGNFSGNGGGLTSLEGGNIQAGTITSSEIDAATWKLMTNTVLPPGVLMNGEGGVGLSGSFDGSFNGTFNGAFSGASWTVQNPMTATLSFDATFMDGLHEVPEHGSLTFSSDAFSFSGPVSATGFSGDGSGLDNLSGANIQAGTITSNEIDAATWELMTNTFSDTLTGTNNGDGVAGAATVSGGFGIVGGEAILTGGNGHQGGAVIISGGGSSAGEGGGVTIRDGNLNNTLSFPLYGPPAFSGSLDVADAMTANAFFGTFTGDGSGLTDIKTTSISGDDLSLGDGTDSQGYSIISVQGGGNGGNGGGGVGVPGAWGGPGAIDVYDTGQNQALGLTYQQDANYSSAGTLDLYGDSSGSAWVGVPDLLGEIAFLDRSAGGATDQRRVIIDATDDNGSSFLTFSQNVYQSPYWVNQIAFAISAAGNINIHGFGSGEWDMSGNGEALQVGGDTYISGGLSTCQGGFTVSGYGDINGSSLYISGGITAGNNSFTVDYSGNVNAASISAGSVSSDGDVDVSGNVNDQNGSVFAAAASISTVSAEYVNASETVYGATISGTMFTFSGSGISIYAGTDNPPTQSAQNGSLYLSIAGKMFIRSNSVWIAK